MIKKIDKNAIRVKRHERMRAKLSGTPETPRLNVYRSLSHIYAQIIDDVNGVTLVAASTVEKDIAAKLAGKTKSAAAGIVLPGIPDGEFNSTDDLYQFAFSKHLHYDLSLGWMFFDIPLDLHAGANVKFIKRNILQNQGSGTGIDFGFKLRTDLDVLFDWEALGKFDFGLNFQDIAGTDISWDTYSEHKDEVLFNTKLGVAVSQPITALDSEVILAYDYDYVYDGCSHYGVQWSYKNIGALRAGYYDKNFTCGASVNLYGVGVDYALVTNPVGITNRIGLRVNF